MKKIQLGFTGLVLVMFVLAGCMQNASSDQPGEFRVASIIDGDTIQLRNGKLVRYLGIDTPEVRVRKGGGWVLSPEPYAFEAKSYNISLVGGKKVRLEFDTQKEDKYGRWLAYVYVDGKMVNDQMLRRGYATLLIYPPNVEHTELFVDAREDAKREKLGLWSRLKNVSPGEAGSLTGEVCAVKGEVLSVERTRGAANLNFGLGQVDAFTAVIYDGNLVFFEKKGIFPVRDYENKYVEVTGKIKDRGGPKIIISHPIQVKVIDN